MDLEGRLIVPTSLPSESCLDKTVETFGLGTYDYPQYGFEHGEDSNKKKSEKALPDDGGPLDPFGPDRLLSYPTNMASTMVPGDLDRPPMFKTPPPSHLDSVVHSVSHTKLPSGLDEVARSDYYDKMTTANRLGPSIEDMFGGADTGAYVSSEKEKPKKIDLRKDSDGVFDYGSLPGIPDNIEHRDNNLGALGNYWSGYTIQDQNVPAGFPSTEFQDESRWQKTNASTKPMKKLAVNIPALRDLTKGFIREHGKKDISRRHIMSFLTKQNQPQYLASDIIRCLAHDHDIYVVDSLEVFPIKKTASHTINVANLRNKIVDLEVRNISNPKVSHELRRAAAELSEVLALLERIGGNHG